MNIPKEIFQEYGFPVPSDLSRFGSGLIHDTFYFSHLDRGYLIQKLNHHIFKDVEGMMENIDKVERFVHDTYPEKLFVSFLRPHSGSSYLNYEDQYWRMMYYIPESKAFDQVSDIKYAYEAGWIIGDFHAALSSFDANQLIETIPHFHDFPLRVKAFEKAQDLDVFDRMKNCAEEIPYLNQLAKEIIEEESALTLPLRVTHNDTKLNNILFNPHDKAICLVDLDTLMPGKIIYDTGDALRTMCNPSGEDGSQGEVRFDKEIFSQFSKGYIHSAFDTLDPREIQSLPFSIIRMSTEQAIRFLTDYLNGDQYYKQPFPGFNLVATKVQIKLLIEVKKNQGWMRDQIESLIRDRRDR